MPTAAKTIAAIYFAGLAYFVSGLIYPLYPEGLVGPKFGLWNAGLGVILGWVFMGRRVGQGWVTALGVGFTTSAAILLWGTFLHSFAQMIRRSLQKVYDGPVEALVDVFRFMIENAAVIGVPAVLAPLAIGGLIGGILVELVNRNFR